MSLFRSTFNFGFMTLVSRLLGFARDVVMARMFGVSAATDAFFVAFKIPNFLRRLFAEGSFSLAFVPVLSEYREKGDDQAVKSLVDNVAGSLLAVLLVITAIGVLAAPWVIAIFAPGFLRDDERWDLGAGMLRVMFPYLLLVSMTALAGGILNTLGRFALPALSPALLNLSMITAALAFSAYFQVPIEAVAWGVLVAGFLQLGLLLPSLARHGLLPRPRWGFAHPGVRRILRLMIPTLFGSSVAQISLLIDTLIASLLITGSVTWLWYADRMMEFPLGVFGVALSTVILPSLASLHARKHLDGFRATLDWALLLGLVIGIPSAVGLAVLAGPLITTLFQYGSFAAVDARMASWALVAYSVGLPAFIGVKILAPAFFSRQDTKTPVIVAVIALVTNMILNVVFVMMLAGFFSGWDFSDGLLATLAAHPGVHLGLALASSLCGWLNAGLLWWFLRKPGLAPSIPFTRLAQVGLAAGLMAAALAMFVPQTAEWIEADLLARLGGLAAAVGFGAGIYFLVLFASGLRPAHLARPAGTEAPEQSRAGPGSPGQS